MNNEYEAVDGYTQGQLAMAVGTSLIFEELDANEKEVKKYKDRIRQFRVNIHTLIRNIQEAMEDEIRTVDNIVTHFMDELESFEEAVNTFFPNAEIVYYVTELRMYNVFIPNVQFRISRSERIRRINEIEHTAVGAVCEAFNEVDRSYERISGKFGHVSKVAIMLTHFPVDLLNYNYYADLFLLESHTGRIRPRNEFSAKIVPREKREFMQYIPFNQLSLRIFGDGNKKLKGGGASVSRPYLELAKQKRWTYLTSKDKIISDINKERIEPLIDFFQ